MNTRTKDLYWALKWPLHVCNLSCFVFFFRCTNDGEEGFILVLEKYCCSFRHLYLWDKNLILKNTEVLSLFHLFRAVKCFTQKPLYLTTCRQTCSRTSSSRSPAQWVWKELPLSYLGVGGSSACRQSISSDFQTVCESQVIPRYLFK